MIYPFTYPTTVAWIKATLSYTQEDATGVVQHVLASKIQDDCEYQADVDGVHVALSFGQIRARALHEFVGPNQA